MAVPKRRTSRSRRDKRRAHDSIGVSPRALRSSLSLGMSLLPFMYRRFWERRRLRNSSPPYLCSKNRSVKYVAKPSFSQMCSQVRHVIRSPNHMCASSCATSPSAA